MEGELFVFTADSTQPRLLLFDENADAFTTVMTSSLLTNNTDVANSITFISNALLFEGATADAFEITLTVADPRVDITYATLDKVAADTLSLLDQGLGPLVGTTVEVPNREFVPSVNVAPRYKFWGRTQPVFSSAIPVNTAGLPVTCAATGLNWLYGPSVVGYGFEVQTIGDNSLCAHGYVAADGIEFAQDAEDNTGFELSQGIVDGSPGAFTIGTSPAFYMSVRFAVATVANTDSCYVGFRGVEAQNDVITGYRDYFMVGIGDLSNGGPGDFQVIGEIDDTAAIAVDLAETDWANNEVHTLSVLVSAAGVTTAEIEGALVTDSGVAQTFTDADIVVPVFHCQTDNTTASVNVDLVFWETGLQ